MPCAPSDLKSAGPTAAIGQSVLDLSVRVKPTSSMRIGIDYGSGSFIVFRSHRAGSFHGYFVEWSGLTTDMRNALIRSQMVTVGGKIIGGI